MIWSDDGWLRLAAGETSLSTVEESNLPSQPFPAKPDRDDFDGQTLDNAFYAPRIRFQRFTSLERKAGYLALRGQESLSSLNKVSLLAKSSPRYTPLSSRRWISARRFISTALAWCSITTT